jgi:hypothetical protein
MPAELVGQKFGTLTVASLLEGTSSGRLWHCICDCGGTRAAITSTLKAGLNVGCKGCESERRAANHITHGAKEGGRKDKLYQIWKGIRGRCRDRGNTSYKYYGARGIRLCDEWNDFAVFREWSLANGYQEGLSIDRRNRYDNYSPEACEWVTRSENSKRMGSANRRYRLAEALLSA